MTSLKSFQAEIEQIATEKHKQAIKEAREAHAAAELARHHGRLNMKKEVISEEADMEVHGEEAKDVPLEVSQVRCDESCSNDTIIGTHSRRGRHRRVAIPDSHLVTEETWRATHPPRRPSFPHPHLQSPSDSDFANPDRRPVGLRPSAGRRASPVEAGMRADEGRAQRVVSDTRRGAIRMLARPIDAERCRGNHGSPGGGSGECRCREEHDARCTYSGRAG